MTEAAAPILSSVSHIAMMARPLFGPCFHMNEAAIGGSPPVPSAPASIPESFDSVEAAMRWRRDQPEPQPEQNSAAERAEPATAAQESAVEADTAPPEVEATSETETEQAPAEPTRPLPRSWSKDKAEVWAKLDPAAQEYLLEQDSKASQEVRRAQNEAAELRKGLTAKEQAAEQARQQYEDRAREAMNVLLREQTRDFPDIRSMEDVTRLAQTDPLRYIQWQAHQQELQAQDAVVKAAEGRKSQETATKRSSYIAEQNKLLAEAVPEFADEKKYAEAMKQALPTLGRYGVTADWLEKLGQTDAGHEIIASAAFRRMTADLIKFHGMQAAAKAVAAKPVPPVIRPGTKGGAAQSSELQAATQAFNLNPNAANAAKLAIARRAQTARR